VTTLVRAEAAVGLPSGVADFADWVRPHLPAMARLAARLAPHADRDDVVQEAMARAWAKRDRFDERRGSPSAWLLAITADQAAKARHPLPSIVRRVEATVSPSPAEDAIDIAQALRRLAPRQRMAINCFYFVGLSVAETAAVMGCAEGTVKSTLADARARLRTLLGVDE
jgi:RNA polymerase sigma factor (sigma-70 family)